LWLFFFSSGHAQEFRGREKKKKIKKKKKLSEPHLDYAINDMEEMLPRQFQPRTFIIIA
jgi:hypothetical protein